MVGGARRDLATSVGLLFVGGYVAWESWTAHPTAFADAGGITPGTLPGLYGVLLIAFSAMLAARALFARRASGPSPGFSFTGLVWTRIAATIALLVVYALLLRLVPFFIVTSAFLAVMFVLFGHRRPMPILAVALLGAGALDALFLRALQLPL